MKKIPVSLILLLFLLTVISLGCKETKFQSTWSGEQAITIDGRYSEWTAPLQYFDKPSMYMGFRNDRDNLYILIKTVDRRAQIKVLRLGLTVWFDPSDHLRKAWGVHYPLGMEHPGIPIMGRDTPGDLNEEQRKQVAEMLGEIEVREEDRKGVEGEGKRVNIHTQSADSLGYGILAAVLDTSDIIVYELKVPLQGNGVSPFSVIPDERGRVRLRFETGDIRPEQWSSIREDSLRVVDPIGNVSTGRMYNKSRPDRSGKPRLTAPPNPITEPIQFEALVDLAKGPGKAESVRK